MIWALLSRQSAESFFQSFAYHKCFYAHFATFDFESKTYIFSKRVCRESAARSMFYYVWLIPPVWRDDLLFDQKRNYACQALYYYDQQCGFC